jgi:tRNA-dihydrouridine synthase A
MMDYTDRHFRVLMRQITRHSLLYTEMVVAQALHFTDPERRERLLGFDSIEHPIALQLGGDDPQRLAEATRMAADRGYDEVNLNVGCPSEKVRQGRFGACLMADPAQVASCVAAMGNASRLPVTVKHRIGIDEQDSYGELLAFVDTVAEAGCSRFAVHARKAWLEGLSPKENRDVPPLDYDLVYRVKRERPELIILVNGGIETLEQADEHLRHVDGVMLGRAAYHEPALLLEVDSRIFGDSTPARSADQAALDFAAKGTGLTAIQADATSATDWDRVVATVTQTPQQGEAILAGEHHIEHHQIGPLALQPGHQLLAGGEATHVVALVGEVGAEQTPLFGIVVHHPDVL